MKDSETFRGSGNTSCHGETAAVRTASSSPSGLATACLSEAPPDWSQIDWDVHCPLCEYNLRGLNVPRCPECGYRFAWKEVLDPDRREHAYLFEHHPRRNLWSFRKTVFGALRSKQFWTSVHPVMPSRPGRLLAYWLATFGCFMAAAILVLFLTSFCELAWNLIEGRGGSPFSVRVGWGWGAAPTTITPGSTWLPSAIWEFLSWLTAQCDHAEELLWMIPLVLFVWPLLTLASLKVFRWSMHRAKVNKVHVRRCVFYSFDMIPPALTMLLALLLMAAYATVGNTAGWNAGWTAGWYEPFLLLLPAVCIGFCTGRLYRAYSVYLRFDHPFLTVLASQVMVALAVMILWLPWVMDIKDRIESPWLRSVIGLLV